MSIVSNRRVLTVLIAVGALVAALGVAQRADAQSLYACVKKNGAARIFTKKPKCKKGESKVSWNIEGRAGKNGPSGLNGLNGKEGAPGKEGKAGANGAVAGFSTSRESPKTFTGEEVVVLSKEIPAGSYLVFAKTVIAASAEAETRAAAMCELVDSTAGLLDTTQWTGPLVKLFSTEWISNASVSLEAALTTKTPTTLFLECTDESNHLNQLAIVASFSQLVAVQTTANS